VGLSGRRQNADIADTLHLRDIAMGTPFCLSMGYNFGCMIASNTLFDSRGGFWGRVLTTLKNLENMEISGNLFILDNSGNLKYTQGILVFQMLFFHDTISNTQQADVQVCAATVVPM